MCRTVEISQASGARGVAIWEVVDQFEWRMSLGRVSPFSQYFCRSRSFSAFVPRFSKLPAMKKYKWQFRLVQTDNDECSQNTHLFISRSYLEFQGTVSRNGYFGQSLDVFSGER